jgi:hypothetical protein
MVPQHQFRVFGRFSDAEVKCPSHEFKVDITIHTSVRKLGLQHLNLSMCSRGGDDQLYAREHIQDEEV